MRHNCRASVPASRVLALVLAISACSGRAASKAEDEERRKNTATDSVAFADSARTSGLSNSGAQRVSLSTTAYANAGIDVITVSAESQSAARSVLEVAALISLDPSRIAIVSSRAAGRLEQVAAVPGQRVGAGQVVALLTSPTFLTAQSDYVQARLRMATLQGTGDEAGAQALLAAARERLQLLGGSDGDIARLDGGGKPSFQLAVRAPLSGSILDALALPGTAVESGTPIFRMADLSAIDVIAQVPQQALGSVHPGQTAWVNVPAFTAERFTGRVVRLQDVVDSTTRTIGAVIRVANSGYRLRPGMFATVRLPVSSSLSEVSATAGAGFIVPASAVITDAGQRYVFVEVGPRTFERRAVTVQPLTPSASAGPTSGSLLLQNGVRHGERVVVRGAVILQSELAKGRLREDG